MGISNFLNFKFVTNLCRIIFKNSDQEETHSNYIWYKSFFVSKSDCISGLHKAICQTF